MAVDVSSKKAGWVRRVVADVIAVVDAINKAYPTTLEYATDAFNGGDLANRPEYQVTDADLVAAGFPQLNAAKLNSFIGGFNALKAAYDSNAGIIEAARP